MGQQQLHDFLLALAHSNGETSDALFVSVVHLSTPLSEAKSKTLSDIVEILVAAWAH